MRKIDLVNTISTNTGMKKIDVLIILENAFREIKKTVSQDQLVSIRGFGTFMTKTRAAKKARIVKKNIEIELPEKKIPFFKASKEFKSLLLKDTQKQ